MSDRIEVMPAADLQPGERELVEVGGRSIGVFNFEGEYYAASNTCPHEGGPACEGMFRGALVGEYQGPGERVKERYSDETPAIACPWHGWEFDLSTGKHLGDPEEALPTYDVVVEDGVLYVDL